MHLFSALLGRCRIASITLTLTLIIVIVAAITVDAAYRVQRPISDTGGRVNQSYLYGEQSGSQTHKGLDFSYGLGTNVYAVADGQVKDVVETWANGSLADNGFGNLVLIRHHAQHYVSQNNGQLVGQMGYVYSIYGHLKQNSVVPNVGDTVYAGQKIAEVDDTGNSSGNHLHLQIVLDQSPDRSNGADYSWTEIASRNPELWLEPFNYGGQQTTTAIGKLTDSAGNPVGGKLIVGMEKPLAAGGDPDGCGIDGYGSSLTYNYTWTNSDDIFGENFATTDVTPGAYHLYAYNNFNYSTCTGSLYKDLGTYYFSPNHPTYVGLYPLHFPDVEDYNWTSTVTVRNNSATDTAQARTTFFQGYGWVESQRRSDYVGALARRDLPPGYLYAGSAAVVASQDLAGVATSVLGPSSARAYSGVYPPGRLGQAGWERAGTDIALPLLMDNNSGWSTIVHIRNLGTSEAHITLKYYDQNGTYSGSVSKTLLLNETEPISQYGSSMPTVGSGRITSDQPIAVVVDEYNAPSHMTYNAFSSSLRTLYLPLLMANNGGYWTGIVVQNLSSNNSTTITVNYYPAPGYAARSPESRTVPPNGIAIFNQSGGQWGSSRWVGAGVVTSSSATIAARVGQINTAGPESLNYSAFIAGAGTPLAILPDIRNNADGWTSGVTVQNVGTQNATVQLKVNNTVTWSGTIAPKSSQSFYPVPSTTSGFSGSVTFNSTNGQPLVAIANHLKASSNSDSAMSYNGMNR